MQLCCHLANEYETSVLRPAHVLRIGRAIWRMRWKIMDIDQRKSHFRLPWREPWSDRHQNTRRSVRDEPPSLCKISAKSVQQFCQREIVPNRQTNIKLTIPPLPWGRQKQNNDSYVTSHRMKWYYFCVLQHFTVMSATVSLRPSTSTTTLKQSASDAVFQRATRDTIKTSFVLA